MPAMRWIALQACITEPGPSLMDDAAAQKAIGSLALGLTPRVTLLDEAVLMEVAGSLRLFGGLAKLAALLEARISLFLASNQAAAQITRAQGATSLIALGRLRLQREQGFTTAATKKRVADLPMHTLSAARPHLGVLERVGCRTWDDLLRLPRDGMARRFDAALLEALDRASGKVPDKYEWLVLPEQFEEKLELNALVEHAPALMAGVGHLLVNLQAWLLGRQSGLCALKITWHLDRRKDVPPTGELEIRTAQPAQDLRHMARLVSEHLAQQALPAPVHALTLQSLVTEFLSDAAAATSSLLMEARRQGDGVVELVERLSARLGDANVQAWQARADHRPEEMQCWGPARDAIKSIAVYVRPSWAGGQKHPLKRVKPAVLPKTDALYPGWLLPEALRLATAGNSPVFQGRLTRLAGPQRLEMSGWLMAGEGRGDANDKRSHPPSMRDYYIYRSEQGSLLWVYSQRLGPAGPERPSRRNWYLQGFFA